MSYTHNAGINQFLNLKYYMAKNESKNWIATWETNSLQYKLPTEKKLKIFRVSSTIQLIAIDKGTLFSRKFY